jgi:hypothetical protein
LSGYRGYFLEVKRLGREVDHSPQSAEVNEGWSQASPPPICLRGVDRRNICLYLFGQVLTKFWYRELYKIYWGN